MSKNKLKLYIWDDFCSDYTSGLAFAIAETESEARELVRVACGDKTGYDSSEWGDVKVKEISKCAHFVTGGS